MHFEDGLHCRDRSAQGLVEQLLMLLEGHLIQVQGVQALVSVRALVGLAYDAESQLSFVEQELHS